MQVEQKSALEWLLVIIIKIVRGVARTLQPLEVRREKKIVRRESPKEWRPYPGEYGTIAAGVPKTLRICASIFTLFCKLFLADNTSTLKHFFVNPPTLINRKIFLMVTFVYDLQQQWI